jgi:hypothetical protein
MAYASPTRVLPTSCVLGCNDQGLDKVCLDPNLLHGARGSVGGALANTLRVVEVGGGVHQARVELVDLVRGAR